MKDKDIVIETADEASQQVIGDDGWGGVGIGETW
jgi:hypothetical protein